MSWLTPPGADTKSERRLRQYRRRERLILWIGGGLAGVIAVFTAIEFTRDNDVPSELLPIVPLAVLAGAACLAFARINFEWASELIERHIDGDDTKKIEDLPDDLKPYPEGAELAYYLELVAVSCAGLGTAVLAVWAAIPDVGCRCIVP